MFCETTLFNSLVCFPFSQCLPSNSLISFAWGSGWGVVLKIISKPFYSLTNAPPLPPPTSKLVPNPWCFACFCFSFTMTRENSNNNSLRKTHMTRQTKKQRQNLFNLLNDGFKLILLFCHDSLVSLSCDFLCWQGPMTNERTILSNFIANT